MEPTTTPGNATNQPNGPSDSQRPTFAGVLVKAVILTAILSAVIYVLYAHRQVSRLKAENQSSASALAATRAQLDALSQKIDSLQPPQQFTIVPAAPAPQKTSPIRESAPARPKTSQHRRSDDPRWKQLQSQLEQNRKAIDDTRNDLNSTRTDLQDSIARTHSDIVVLQKKGERNYYEFDIPKSGQFHHNGSVGIRLKKANTKHQFADLELLVDDVKLSKKHINLYEPVLFYPADSRQPTELVINGITKDHIHGYVSQPKYRPSELASDTNSAASTTQPDAQHSQGRQRLTLPQ